MEIDYYFIVLKKDLLLDNFFILIEQINIQDLD